MAEGDFQVVFRGELTGELPEDEVRKRLAALFKMSPEKVEGLFTGKPIVVKRNLDEATARKFEGAFQKAGAKCELRSAGSSESTASTGAQPQGASSSGSRTSSSAAARARASMAAAGDPNQTLLEMDVPSDFSGMEIDDSGQPLSGGDRPAEPEIDIGDLSVSRNESENLSEPRPAPPSDIDTSGLALEDD